MSSRRIVITGGPGTGKTSLINELNKRGFRCLEEISRQVTMEAKKEGIDQLFLSDPLLFSDKLLEGRQKQYLEAGAMEGPVFLDRGIPDVLAYLEYARHPYPDHYIDACRKHVYDHVFVLAPWQEIYESDNERYESFEQAIQIHDHLLRTYSIYDYHLNDVPFGSVTDRTDFILSIAEKF
ncbi:MAG: ATP-binding protein [Flavobacteriaceae bacterium]|nr:ATP-binding protein [Bacteroidia bacterium]MBT8287898.1 ATP-binding protein [Bacteroidia bacterium]NNF74516.1 ATP-binding protein [Flavobacteriaceae bacterium]NNK73268.1 ATP-binding protein [Flavobacteriaceae bacterium]